MILKFIVEIASSSAKSLDSFSGCLSRATRSGPYGIQTDAVTAAEDVEACELGCELGEGTGWCASCLEEYGADCLERHWV